MQILCINALRPAAQRFALAKAGRVNPVEGRAKRRKTASGKADTAFRFQVREESRPAALYRAVTLSSSVSASCS
jgi:hypothetical protein